MKDFRTAMWAKPGLSGAVKPVVLKQWRSVFYVGLIIVLQSNSVS